MRNQNFSSGPDLQFAMVLPGSDTVQPITITNLVYDALTCSGHIDAIDLLGGCALSFFQGNHNLAAMGAGNSVLWTLENIVLESWRPSSSVTRFIDCRYLVSKLRSVISTPRISAEWFRDAGDLVLDKGDMHIVICALPPNSQDLLARYRLSVWRQDGADPIFRTTTENELIAKQIANMWLAQENKP